jgi:hypothetical protein
VKALAEQPRHLALELADLRELAQPLRLARELPVARLVGRCLYKRIGHHH